MVNSENDSQLTAAPRNFSKLLFSSLLQWASNDAVKSATGMSLKMPR
jgi:hypothetical protein